MINKKSVLFRWIVSYLLLIIFIISFLAIVFKTVEREIISEIEYANEMQIDMVLKTMEPEIEELKLVYSNLMRNIELNNLVNAKLYKKSDTAKNVKSVCNYMASAVFGKNGVDEVFVYQQNNDMILSAHGYADAATTYDAIWGRGSYDKLEDVVRSQKYGRFVLLGNIGEKKQEYIGYLQTIPINVKNGNPKAVVLTMLDSKKLSDRIKEIVKDNAEITITDNFGDKLLRINGEKGYNEKSSISFTRKGNSGINYKISTPKKIYWSRLYHLKRIVWFVAAIIVLGGLMISVMLARKNYAPIKKIMKNFNNDITNGKEVDEYTYINKLIAEVISKLREREKVSANQEKQLNEYRLEKIAKGETEYLDDEFIKSFRKVLISDNFMMAFFKPDDIEAFFKKETSMDKSEKLDVAKFIIRNVAAELIENEKCRSFFFESGIYLVAVINTPPEGNEALSYRLKKTLDDGFIVVYENFDITVNGALSTVHRGINAIANCYKECYEVEGYIDMTGESGIKVHDELEIHNGYDYTIEQDIALTESIKNASYERASCIINEIFANNTKRRKITRNALGYLVVNIVGTLMRIEDDNTELLSFLGQIEDMLEKISIGEIKERLLQIINNMCEHNRVGTKKNDSDIELRVKKLISENYSDVNLNVQMIGEKLELSPYYVSKLFKEITGVGIADYIRKYRIGKAKELIKTTNLKMDDIAKSVGISDARCFNGIFKRTEGIAPSKYREMVK